VEIKEAIVAKKAKSKKVKSADFQFVNGGSVCLLIPVNGDARRWLDENIGEDAIYLGRGLAIERRFVSQIVDGIVADGFRVADDPALGIPLM
jgi:hypothetical protein